MNTEESWAKSDEVICNDKIEISDGPSGPVPLPDRAAGSLRPRRHQHPHAVGLPLRFAGGHGGANFNFLHAIQDPMPVLNAGWGNCTTCVYEFDESRASEVPDGHGAGPWRLLDVVRL